MRRGKGVSERERESELINFICRSNVIDETNYLEYTISFFFSFRLFQ